MNSSTPATGPHRYANGTRLSLSHRLGAGREGEVHQVANRPGHAAKTISHLNPDPGATAAKLQTMVKNPPQVTAARAYHIAWPTALIREHRYGGPVTGYLMPILDPDAYRPVGAYFNPAGTPQETHGPAEPGATAT